MLQTRWIMSGPKLIIYASMHLPDIFVARIQRSKLFRVVDGIVRCLDEHAIATHSSTHSRAWTRVAMKLWTHYSS
jgi:hypothetical protein